MMAQWQFNRADPSDVYMDPNQGDQFNNDDVDLAEALVRETIQNSSDAKDGTGNPVKVRFDFVTLEGGRAKKIRQYVQSLQPHLEAVGLDRLGLNHTDPVNLLIIEDFNTIGLTGRFDIRDTDNFTSFWRNLARSEKSGRAGGRWGLGKLVYSAASQIRSFFGLTFRSGDANASVMGQSVLKHHKIGDTSFVPHGFWFEGRSPYENLQLPVTDLGKVNEFAQTTGIARRQETGLSIIIPFVAEGIDKQSVLSGVVNNYYFPILSGKLEVEVGTTLVNANTFLEVANENSHKQVPFSFVKEISDVENDVPPFRATGSIGKKELGESHLAPSDIEHMKELFAEGALVSIRVPVLLRPKNSSDLESYVDLHLKALPESGQPFALFSRGPIILSSERRHFAGASAYGALIANEENVARFLGDAENPAHTRWNPHAEKLKNNWRMPNETLATIRHSLKAFYYLVADEQEVEDTDALMDFFSIEMSTRKKPGNGPASPRPEPDPENRETAINIQPRKGGFGIISGTGAKKWNFPRRIRIRLAYDMIGADPFKRHSTYDFNLQKEGGIRVDSKGGTVNPIKSNILVMTVNSPEFSLEATGFDINRDLVVEARAVEQKS